MYVPIQLALTLAPGLQILHIYWYLHWCGENVRTSVVGSCTGLPIKKTYSEIDELVVFHVRGSDTDHSIIWPPSPLPIPHAPPFAPTSFCLPLPVVVTPISFLSRADFRTLVVVK